MKRPPLLCQQNAVGLDAVGDVCAGRTMCALEFNNPAKVIQTENRRFASVPGKEDFAPGAIAICWTMYSSRRSSGIRKDRLSG